jgi:hypothetical protein
MQHHDFAGAAPRKPRQNGKFLPGRQKEITKVI